ncbi:hypothetical protein QU408_08895 [Lactobacillus crispatus]|uniref:hypothetical protein n=1 Tax=Lactobacillus crispatus TaxID=47770 RepID=UPI003D6AE0F1
MTTKEKIIYYRTKICINYSNTAWLKATDYQLPLDNQYCGKKLWSLWYSPDSLSLTSLEQQNINSCEILRQYIELDKQLNEAFAESVKNGKQIIENQKEPSQSSTLRNLIQALLAKFKN